MEGKEIIIKVQIFEGDKETYKLSVDDLDCGEMEFLISRLTAELKKRMED